ncbi:GTPase Era [Anaplasmataceae bacterium AB001_6]|nr:GTPase Era [Anaplasmataceae bacterium AB001_6]
MNSDKRKFIKVGIIGPSNVGKSTFVNAVMKIKVSAVTNKVQTTRSSLQIIKNYKNTQIVFVDNPGVFVAKRTLERIILTNAWSGVSDVDVVMVMVDASKGITSNVINIVDKLKNFDVKCFVVINKIDLIPKKNLLLLLKDLKELRDFQEFFMISAYKNMFIDSILDYLEKISYVSEWKYPEDKITDASLDYRIKEVSREKFFQALNQEIPYSIVVENEKIVKSQNGCIVINQTLYVLKENHKKIIIGKSGSKIAVIRKSIEYELSKMLKTNVKVIIYVKVHYNWFEDDNILSNIYN